jgi:glycine betaine/choline ABC-type transport system substrate-binding protein
MNNTQALATTRRSRRATARTLSDVAVAAPQLRLGAIPEFLKRSDGLPGLQRATAASTSKRSRLLDIGLKYKALLDGDVDVVVAFGPTARSWPTTSVVIDDKHFFPAYQSRRSCAIKRRWRAPALAPALNKRSRRC